MCNSYAAGQLARAVGVAVVTRRSTLPAFAQPKITVSLCHHTLYAFVLNSPSIIATMQQAAMSTMSTSTVMHAARAPSSTSLRATLLPLRTSRRSASRVVRVQAAINTGSQNKDGFVEVRPTPATPLEPHFTTMHSLSLPTPSASPLMRASLASVPLLRTGWAAWQ